ncbi:MAG: hypothetical protein Q4F66_09250 [Clostridium sp.]|nr:hypothetical protein [Clostridium sp.]
MNNTIKKEIGMIRTEIKRIYSLKYVVVSICMTVFILSMGAIMYSERYGKFTELQFYDMFTSIFIGGYFYELIFIPIGLFILINLCTDINQKMVYMLASRSGVGVYIRAKIIAAIVFSFMISFLSIGSFIVIFSSYMTMFYDAPTYIDIYTKLLETNIVLYFIVRVYFISLATVLFTLIAMLITVLIPNSYVAAMSSFFSFVIIDKLILILGLPNEVNITNIIAGLLNIGDSMSRTVVYVTFFFGTSIYIVSIVFYKMMKWRCYGERT